MQSRFIKGTFVVVPNKEVINGAPAHMQAVYFWLCAYADERGICYPSRTRLAKDAGCSVRSVDNSIDAMVSTGLLKKITRKDPENPKQNLTNIYQIMIYDKEGGGAGDAPGWRTMFTRGGAGGAEGTTTNLTTTKKEASPPFEVVSDSPPKDRPKKNTPGWDLREWAYEEFRKEFGVRPTVSGADYVRVMEALKRLTEKQVKELIRDALSEGKKRTVRECLTNRAIDIYLQENQ